MNCLTKSVSSSVGMLYRFQAISGVSLFHSSTPCRVGSEWRRQNGLPTHANSDGVLAHSPDYTFLDGRPTPAQSNLLKKAMKQRELTRKIIQYTSEVDFAVDNHQKRLDDEEQGKRNILNRKLKPKGRPMTRNE